MIVSRIKHADRQSVLWPFVNDRDFASMAQTRNAVGEWCEVAGAALFKASRHATVSTATVCPDLSLRLPLRYIECKSIGLTRQGLVYSQRLVADRALAKSVRGRYCYAFFIHDVAASKCRTLYQLHAAMADGLRRILVVSFAHLDSLCDRHPARVMNYRGATKARAALPMPGHRLPYREILAAAAGMYQQERMAWAADVYGFQVSVPVIGCDLDAVGLNGI